MATSSEFPNRPPKKPQFSISDFFNDIPPLPKRDIFKIVERMATHCIWEKLERLGFKVYGEQYIGKIEGRRRIIDLIAEKEGKLIGVEVKCKSFSALRKDIKQFKDYKKILDEMNIPLLILWVPVEKKYPYIYDYAFYRLKNEFYIPINKTSLDEEILNLIYPTLIEFMKNPPFYKVRDLLQVYKEGLLPLKRKRVPMSMEDIFAVAARTGRLPSYRYKYIDDLVPSLLYLPIEFEYLFEWTLNQKGIQKVTISLKKEEANFEHEIWKILRKKGYKVFCQYPVKIQNNKPKSKKGTIDLLTTYSQRLGIEVKNKLTSRVIDQLKKYRNSSTLDQYDLYLAIPTTEKRKIYKIQPTLDEYGIGVLTIENNKLKVVKTNTLEALENYIT